MMRNIIFSIFVLAVFFSCNAVPKPDQSANSEIWEKGIFTINGEVLKVESLEGGQTILLKDNENKEYSCFVHADNLNDKSAKYREFAPGEIIGFRGMLSKNNKMIVEEILEMR